MSVAYTTTSFGASSLPSRPQHSSARHQRQSSVSSGSTAVTAAIEPRDSDLPGLPPPVTADPSTRAMDSQRVMYDQIGAFFGARPSTGRNSSSGLSQNDSTMNAVPPAYDSRSEIESLPTYSKVEDYDAVLSRKCFKGGFIFFPLWIVGIVAPFVKPKQDPAKDNRTKEDQEADYVNMRKAEMRWAWRCAAALLSIISLIVIAVVVGVTVSNRQ